MRDVRNHGARMRGDVVAEAPDDIRGVREEDPRSQNAKARELLTEDASRAVRRAPEFARSRSPI